MRTVLLALHLLSSPGNAREFPIGLFGVGLNVDLTEVADAGFTHILSASGRPEDQAALSQRARRTGLAFIGFPSPSISGKLGAVNASAWYLSDEPDVNGEDPAEIRRQASRVRSWDSRTPLILTVGAGARAADYAPSVDAVLVDWYPVPHLPLGGLGSEIAAAVAGVADKPVWAVVQAMDWRDYPQRDPNKPRTGRFPSLREMRFMAYHAVVNGAAGVFFFELRKRSRDGTTLLDLPEQWQALRTVAKELRVLSPFFAKGSAARLELAGLVGRSWSRSGRTLVVLLNPAAEPLPIPAEFLSGDYSAAFEGQRRTKDLFPDGVMQANRTLILLR
ncbi:MAG: hypothetical protein HYZ75_15385 [Elusimicrobia bacterium]|nr:hypothetical protein [Elusimicrobiota bacterium]